MKELSKSIINFLFGMNSPPLHRHVVDILKQEARTVLEEQNHSGSRQKIFKELRILS